MILMYFSNKKSFLLPAALFSQLLNFPDAISFALQFIMQNIVKSFNNAFGLQAWAYQNGLLEDHYISCRRDCQFYLDQRDINVIIVHLRRITKEILRGMLDFIKKFLIMLMDIIAIFALISARLLIN